MQDRESEDFDENMAKIERRAQSERYSTEMTEDLRDTMDVVVTESKNRLIYFSVIEDNPPNLT